MQSTNDMRVATIFGMSSTNDMWVTSIMGLSSTDHMRVTSVETGISSGDGMMLLPVPGSHQELRC